jgi:hypothetical protein
MHSIPPEDSTEHAPQDDLTRGDRSRTAARRGGGAKMWAMAAAVAAIAAFVAWPYITAHRLKSAVQAGDAAALADLVEFPSVRQGLKDQLNARALDAVAKDGNDMLAGLGLALAGAFIDKAVDAYVTPAGMARLLAADRSRMQADGGAAVEDDAAADPREPFAGATMAYRSFDRFEVTLPGKGGRSGQLVLRRRGLGWKLTDIIVPME